MAIETNVAGPLAPLDPRDQYGTHNETYGVGGFRTVDTLVDLYAIPSLRRKKGMEVKVLENGVRYELGADLSNSSWTPVTIVSGSIIDRGIL